MNKLLLVAALTGGLALSLAGTAAAQTQLQGYRTEVCVNASNAEQAKQLFPNAILHVIPDFTDPSMNGWRIVSGYVAAHGKIMTDTQEIALRRAEDLRRFPQGQ